MKTEDHTTKQNYQKDNIKQINVHVYTKRNINKMKLQTCNFNYIEEIVLFLMKKTMLDSPLENGLDCSVSKFLG